MSKVEVRLVHTLSHSSVVCCVRFANNGLYFATSCNKYAFVYDVNTGKKIAKLSAEGEDVETPRDLYIRSLCFSPDSKFLATGAEDKLIKLWNLSTYQPVLTLSGHDVDVYSLDYSSDSRFIVSGSGDKKLKVWDVNAGKAVMTLGDMTSGPTDGVSSVAISPDSKLVGAGSLDTIVRVWDLNSGRLVDKLNGHQDSVYSVAFNPDGRTIASGSLDKSIRLWELQHMKPQQSGTGEGGSQQPSSASDHFRVLNGHKDYVLSVVFTVDGQWVISGSRDRLVQVWDVQTGTASVAVQGHKNTIISIARSATADLFATGSGDYRARIWSFVKKGESSKD